MAVEGSFEEISRRKLLIATNDSRELFRRETAKTTRNYSPLFVDVVLQGFLKHTRKLQRLSVVSQPREGPYQHEDSPAKREVNVSMKVEKFFGGVEVKMADMLGALTVEGD